MCNGDRVGNKIQEPVASHWWNDCPVLGKKKTDAPTSSSRLPSRLPPLLTQARVPESCRHRQAAGCNGRPILLRTGTAARPIGCALTRRMKIAKICRPPTKTQRSKFLEDFLFFTGSYRGRTEPRCRPERRDTEKEKKKGNANRSQKRDENANPIEILGRSKSTEYCMRLFVH